MTLEETLKCRLTGRTVERMRNTCSGASAEGARARLYALVTHADDRVGYNALWVFTHFSAEEIKWLEPKRNELVDIALSTSHSGKRRLALNLLERLPISVNDLRGDYLDFCLSRINSTEPYGIRALCLRQAFAQCRFYPELMAELEAEIELMDAGGLSPGMAAARRGVEKAVAAMRSGE